METRCSSPQEAMRRACEVEQSRQLLGLHRLLRPPRWMHACGGAGGGGPASFHAGTASHKSTSSSPTGGGSVPWRLSSLPCFLLTEQKTNIKTPRNASEALSQLLPHPGPLPKWAVAHPLERDLGNSVFEILSPFPCSHKFFKGDFAPNSSVNERPLSFARNSKELYNCSKTM